MAKSWEEVKKEREGKLRSSSNPEQNKSSKMINQGFLVADPKPQQRKWEDIRKDRGYLEPEPAPTDYWKEQPVKTVWKNINAGINMLPRGMVGIADATVGGLGIEPVNKVLDSYKDYYKKADEELAMRNTGHEFAGGVAQGIGQAIPTMALALMNPAAAASSVVPTTVKGTQLVANAASLANPTTLNAARTVAMNLKSNPTLYSSMVTSVGNQYLQGLNEGASREQAIKSAIIGGVPSALIEVSGGIENITNILANKTKGVAGAMFLAALEEGFEEIVQYPIENIGQKIAYDKEMPLFSMKDQAVINPKEMAFSGAVGATVGGLMGGGAAGVNTALNNKYSKIVDAEYKNVVNSLPDDSPILARVNQMQDDNVNIDDNTKVWVINSARQQQGTFESETDKLLNSEGQKETFFQDDNIVDKQTVEWGQNIVKTQNNTSQAVNPILSAFRIQNIENAREVKQNVYEFYKNSIISDSNVSKPIINKSSGMNVEVSRATINQTFQADEKYSKNQDNEIKVTAMANVVDLIQNGEFTVVDNSDAPSNKTKYAEIKGTVNVNGTPYEITMDVRRTDNGKKLFVHSLSTNQQQTIDKKSGVVYNGTDEKVRQQYPKVYDILDRIGNATNTKFKFVETIYDPSGQEVGFANGQYDPSTDSIEIALDTFNPFMVVAKHEITHMLEKENPKLYREYKDYVLSAMKENGSYDAEFGRIASLYENRGLGIDDTAIEDELVADATELFLTDENAINDLVAENKTLGQKILDVLKKMIAKIEDILEVAGFTEGWLNTEQLREAERLWVNALNNVAETEQETDTKMDRKQSLKKDNPYNERSYHPFKENEKWSEQFERRTKWLREEVDGIKTGKFKGSFGMYATVTPSIKDGKYQITVFDKNDTPMMDAQRNTVDEIAEFLQEDGFVFPEQITRFSLKNIENALVANHGEYKNDKKALKMASEALIDLNKIKYSTKNSGIETIADGLTREFITEGYVNFNGRKFKNFGELAQIMQIYRDPRFETLRYIYVKEKSKTIHDEYLGDYKDSTYTIVGHEAVSSRMPGLSQSIPNLPKRSDVTGAEYEKAFYSGMDKIKGRMKKLKADGYFILHNHPSGNVDPSSNDRQLTKFFANKIDGFKGHVVINSNQYATITLNNYNSVDTSVRDISQQSIDYHKQPSVYNEILDFDIKKEDGGISRDGIAEIAKAMQYVDDKSYILYVSNYGEITGFQMIPNGMIYREMQNSNENGFSGFVKNRLVDFGAGNAFLMTGSRNVYDYGLKLIDKRYFTDVIRVNRDNAHFHGRDEANPSPFYDWAGVRKGDVQAKRVFSLKAPVEETADLIALHNITEEKLKGTLELGGFPVPSIAVSKAEYGHQGFGGITVVFTKDTIDPEFIRKNKVFTQDVYSKRVPAIKNRQTNTQFEKINDIFMPYFEKLEQSIRSYSNKWEDTNIDDAVYELSRQTAAKMAYLDSKGIETKIPYKKKALNRINEESAKAFWKKHKNVDEVDLRNNKEKWNDAVREVLEQDRKIFEEKMGKKYPGEELSERLSFAVYDRTVRDLLKRKNGIAEKVIDIDKITDTVNKKVNPKAKDFENWLRDTIGPYFGDKYFRDDNDRRRDYTLENLTQYMKGDIKNQEKTMVYGLGKVIASTGQELTSIADIKKASTNLTDSETRAKYKAELEAFDENVRSTIAKERINSRESFFDVFEDYYKALTQFLSKKKSAKSALSSNGFRNATDDMLNQFREVGKRIKDTPPEYFEAKPQRAVGFDEVAAMVVPKTTDKELLQQLKDKAIKVVRYDSEVEGDRLKKVNSVKGAKFSLKDSKGRTLTNEQTEYFKDSTIRDKDGNLKVVYHGGTVEYEFDTNRGKTATQYGSGAYFTDDNGAARIWSTESEGKVVKGYAKMTTPFDDRVWGNLNQNSEEFKLLTKLLQEKGLEKYEMNRIFQESEFSNKGTPFEEMRKILFAKTGEKVSGYGWKGAELANQLIKQAGYDGIIADLFAPGQNEQYIIFNPEQIKSIDNFNPTENPDIRYQLKDMTVKNNAAKYTPERLENVLGRYGSKGSPNYSQAYVAHLSPDEFLSLTTTNLSKIESESRELNLEDLQNETQEVFLKFDIDDKEVTGHEGRHRMVALRDAGIKSVPIVLWQDGEKGKYNKTILKSLKLTGEEFSKGVAPGNVEIKNMVPASRAYEKTLTRDFVDAKGETEVRFQLRDDRTAKDVEKLQNTVLRLKEQFKLTKGVKLDEKAVRRLSKSLLKDYSSKYSSTELETKLYNVYMGMVNGNMEYDEAQLIITEVARDIIENASILSDAMYKQYTALRQTMRNSSITIDDKYKGDFDAVGGWNDFRKRNFGRMNISDDGVNIDKLYQELSDTYPELFIKDIANQADQLMLISDVLDSFIPIYENPYNRDLNEAVEYLAYEIFDGMTSVPEAKPTFADRKNTEKQKAVEKEKDKSKARIETIKGKNKDDAAYQKYVSSENKSKAVENERNKALEKFEKLKKKYEGREYVAWWNQELTEQELKYNKDKIVAELKEKQKDDIVWLKYQNKEKLAEVLNKEKAKRDDAVAKVRKQYQDKDYKTWWRNKLNENEIKSHYQEMIKDLRANRDEKLEQQKTKYKERISGIYEDRKVKQAKDRIKSMTNKLSKMLRNPTQKQHIPKSLDKTIAELLVMLDFTTDKQGENTVLKLRDLRAEYEKIAKVSDADGIAVTADPYIMDALEMLHDKRITDMNLQEVELLRDVIGYFENMVRTFNKAFRQGKWVEVSTISEGIMGDLKTNTPMTESAYGVAQNFKNMMQWGMVTPQMFFERMGNNFESLWVDFRGGLDTKIRHTETAQDYMAKLLKGTNVKEWTGNKAQKRTIRLESGKSIELTQAQLMSFYLLMKREQARGHIFGLGIKAAPIVTVDNKGIKRMSKQFEPVKITLDDATKLIGSLTKEQRRIADGIGKFMNTYSKQWVNEATLQLYGYEIAKEENYFPIKSDKDFLKSDFDNTNLDPTFTSMGFLKSTVKGAGNAIVIEDAFDVFTEHADKSATYNAFVGATENMKKIVNYKTKEDSIKQAMNKRFGMQSFNYLKKLMVDLQGGIRTESGSPIVSSLIRNTKRTVLGLNVRTIVQQPTAIIRAAALIDADYLMKGAVMKGDMAEMLKYSPIAKWKSWGYFSLDTGRTMKDIMLGATPILDRQYDAIQKADDITWTKIWNAVKLEIDDTNPEIKKSSKEYFDAVSERFTEIIDRTQVVDTVMHRSDIMRQSDSSWKALTAFMSEPTKSYNMLLNAVEKYNNNKTAENKEALLRTTSAWMATTLVNTLVVTLVDVWRRKEDDDESMLNKYIDNILNEVTGYVPLVRDLYSILQGYSIKRMEYNGFERIGRAVNRSGKYIMEIVEGKKHNYPLRLITKDWIESIAYIFGVGAINVNREIEAVMRNYTRWIDDEGVVNDMYKFMFKK